MEKSKPFRLQVTGRFACFTRPEMKVERVSYDVMTPSAARGIFEAILWKPAISWKILEIDLIRPITWFSIRRNEVASVVSAKTAMTAMKSGTGRLGIYADVGKERQQRASLILRDVGYVIHALFEMTEKAGPEDNVTKFEQMFLRRASKGQCFHRPYLGCREFPADFELIPIGKKGPDPISQSRELGWMLYDMDYTKKPPVPAFFRAELKNGVLDLRYVEVRS